MKPILAAHALIHILLAFLWLVDLIAGAEPSLKVVIVVIGCSFVRRFEFLEIALLAVSTRRTVADETALREEF